MPIVILLEADSMKDAQKKLDDWLDELDLDHMPEGTENVDVSPECDISDDSRTFLLPNYDDEETEELDEEIEEEFSLDQNID